MKRIGLLTLALVLALGSLGLAYAAWTDEITIRGTVDTGSVDLEVVKYSGTWVWKDVEEQNETFVWDAEYEVCPPMWPAGYDPQNAIAWAFMRPPTDAELAVDPDLDVVGEARNIFPTEHLEWEFCADVLLHYTGSVPAIIQAVPVLMEAYDPESGEVIPNGNLLTENMGWDHTQTPPEPGFIHDDASLWRMNEAGELVFVEGLELYYEGYQAHYCDYIWLKVYLNLPQNNALQGLGAKWAVDIEATQWDEWPYTPPAGGA